MQQVPFVAGPNAAPPMVERRSSHRFEVIVPGRYTVVGGPEHTCVTENISPEGVALRGLFAPRPQAEVICDLRGVGRLEGVCLRRTEAGFVLSIRTASMPLVSLAAKLRRLSEAQEVGVIPARSAERLVPHRTGTVMSLGDGTKCGATIINVSRSGVALRTPVRPALDSIVVVGGTPARVVRHFASGIGAAFMRPLPVEQVTADVVL